MASPKERIHVPANGVSVDLRRKVLVLNGTKSLTGIGITSSYFATFPLIRTTVCTKCNEPVSIWAEGRLPETCDLAPHRGPWRHETARKDAFVLLAKAGHGFRHGTGDNPHCTHTGQNEVLGPGIKLALSTIEDEDCSDR